MAIYKLSKGQVQELLEQNKVYTSQQNAADGKAGGVNGQWFDEDNWEFDEKGRLIEVQKDGSKVYMGWANVDDLKGMSEPSFKERQLEENTIFGGDSKNTQVNGHNGMPSDIENKLYGGDSKNTQVNGHNGMPSDIENKLYGGDSKNTQVNGHNGMPSDVENKLYGGNSSNQNDLIGDLNKILSDASISESDYNAQLESFAKLSQEHPDVYEQLLTQFNNEQLKEQFIQDVNRMTKN